MEPLFGLSDSSYEWAPLLCFVSSHTDVKAANNLSFYKFANCGVISRAIV